MDQVRRLATALHQATKESQLTLEELDAFCVNGIVASDVQGESYLEWHLFISNSELHSTATHTQEGESSGNEREGEEDSQDMDEENMDEENVDEDEDEEKWT